MVELNWTLQSKNDLIAIGEFIAQDSKKYAKIQIQRLKERASQLKKFPASGRIVPEVDNPEIREVILGNYRIIYRIVNTVRIDILTVHHSARILSL